MPRQVTRLTAAQRESRIRMVTKFLHLVIGLLAGLGAHLVVSSALTSRPKPLDWPCPSAQDILPCVCSFDEYYRLTIDCSAVDTEDQLQNAFDAAFPITDFLELRIDQVDQHGTLASIPVDTFHDLTFESVVIQGTRLASVHDQTFASSHSKLRHMDLSNNELLDFPFVSVSLYRELQILLVDGNRFPQLPSIQSTSLQILSFSDNRGMAIGDSASLAVPSLREIYLARLNLPVLRPGFFSDLQGLRVIDLGGNELTELDTLAIATKGQSLAFVDLSYNQISKVRHDSVRGLSDNATLSMTHNNIEELQEESWKHIFDQLVPSGSIDLAGNPLTCGCDLAWIMLQEEDAYRPLITDTTKCNSGEVLIFLDPNIFSSYCPGLREERPVTLLQA